MKNRRNLRLALAAATLLAVSAEAAALWGDRLEIFASDTVTRDSNVFRISRDRDANAYLGSSSKDDTYNTAAVGFNLDVPVSRQRLQAGASLNQVRYHRFSDLDFNGHEAHALWLWQVGDPWNGQLGYTESKALASFINFQSRVADPLTTRRAYGTASYLMTPHWRLQGGLAQTEQRHGHALRLDNDVDLADADFTVNYISTAGNSIGIGVRQQEGRYPHRQSVSGTLYDNAYTQRGIGVVADWTPTGKSHFNARVDRLRRDYDQLSQRDFEGTTVRALYDWRATGKLTVTATAQRDISAAEDIQTSFVLVKGFSLRPSLQLTEKINVSATADYSIRNYLGDPGLALGTATARTDRVRAVGAAVSYRPLRSLTLLLSALHEARTSNVSFADYTANVISINGRFSF